MSERRVQFTVEARATYDTLPAARRAQLDRAVRVLARDPFRRAASAPIGPDEHVRRAYVGPGLIMEYAVAGAVLAVVAVEAFEESAYLIDSD
ncbi:hypothetical protein RKD23_002298 [Streptomyces sp. SAI-170]|uniref:hypothetical protein n=1 Tax=Streptomyces sp. SAI-170 TaxID=3377729 RepID=UPI003C7B0849